MALESHFIPVHKEITAYLAEHGGFVSKRGHQNYFDVYRDGVDVSVRLYKPTARNGHFNATVEIYCDSDADYACFFNFLGRQDTGEMPYRLNAEKETYTDVGQLTKSRSKAIKIERRFRVPADLEDFATACEWLVQKHREWSQGTCVRRIVKETAQGLSGEQLVQLVEDVGISRDTMQNYLWRGLAGVTHPQKREGVYHAALWFDERVVPELPVLDWAEETWLPSFAYKESLSNKERCWLLVANPQYWSFTNLAEGEEDTYSVYTEKGNPRQVPRNFALVEPGEPIVCYEAYPVMQVLALGEITAGSDGKTIGFVKTKELPRPVSRETLMLYPELNALFENLHGSLHELSKEQYHLIVDMCEGKAVPLNKPRNRVIFGAPGTGKSWLLKSESEDVPPQNIERVTFHPEYSYFDFVGSYKPVMSEGTIAYGFVPGPFARVLKSARENPSQNWLLVIEELNRARVSSVFGDVFQLLDRGETGESEYGITPSEDWRRWMSLPPGEKVKIPSNMYIWATMNSADQGVYPVDTAFKRRWSFEYMGIDSGKEKVQGALAAEWLLLRARVNALLQEADVNEDKHLGPFFLNSGELSTAVAFSDAVRSKVLMYLYEDAARHKRKAVFEASYATGGYSALVAGFDSLYKSGGIELVLGKIFHT